MTAIRTIEAAQADAILAEGRPAGLYMAESDVMPMRWIGISSDGEAAERKYGPFGDVLTWLMIRAGILPETGECEVRVVEDRPASGCGVSAMPVRIPGAVIQPWEDTPGPEIPEGMDAEILSRLGEGMSVKEIVKEVGLSRPAVYNRLANMARRRGLLTLGEMRVEAIRVRNAKLDAEIIPMVEAGMRAKAIAKKLGCKLTRVADRIRVLREEGRL